MRLYYAIILSLLSVVGTAQQEALTATLDSTEMWIGDRMRVRLNLDQDEGFVPLAVTMEGLDSMPSVEMYGNAEWDFEAGSWTAEIGLAVFDTGYFLLPPVTVSGTRGDQSFHFHSRRLGLYVKPVPIDSLGVRSIKPIVEEPPNWSDFQWIFLAVGILILLGLLAWLFRRLSSHAKTEPGVPPREAHLVALEALEKLEKERLYEQGKIKEYYVALGNIVRTYFENRFGFSAMEMTRTELQDAMKVTDELSSHRHEAQEFFQLADMVKFANAIAPQEMHNKYMKWAQHMVEATAHSGDDEEDEGADNLPQTNTNQDV